MNHPKLILPALVGCIALGISAGCSPRDPRQNSNPHPQGALDQNQPPKSAPATSSPADAKTGTDSTGRPADASGGTTGSDAAKNPGDTPTTNRP